MQDDNRFEVRKGIKNHERHNAMLQAAYDTVDRMATLLGDLTFGELLTLPLGEVFTQVTPKIPVLASHGLIGDADEVLALFDRLVKAHGDVSFRDMGATMSAEGAKLSREYYSPVYKLWFYHGIRLPEYGRNIDYNEKTLKRLDDVVALADDFSYRSMYTTGRSKDTKAATIAIRNAADCFIIYLPPGNGLCCSCTFSGCSCVTAMSTDYCSGNGPSGCSSNSTSCSNGGDEPIFFSS